ncbi:MAG: LacI family DNA-binding transcriptional regulator [Rhodobacteraceae bacterium]|nr:LacI family DNA-binding transcriptional regulator [Paracoccaceae bacterium]
MRPTVQDVARQAGVSLATVDRVLNRRPGVRKVTIAKVETAIAALGYIRDISAANLAKQQAYRFAFVIPDGSNSFMHGLEAEIEAVKLHSAANRTEISIYKVPTFDSLALAATLDRLDPRHCSGVAVVATEDVVVQDALARLCQNNIPVVTLVSDTPARQGQTYVGIDNVAAGRTAGRLMGSFLGARSGKIVLLAGSMVLRDHVERHMGFDQVIISDYNQLQCLPIIESMDDSGIVKQRLRRCLAAHTDIVGIYNMGAGNRGLIEVLSADSAGNKHVVVAHELTEHTRRALNTGTFDAIIHQDAGHEVRSALRILKAQIDKTPLLAGQETIRIEIYLNENM